MSFRRPMDDTDVATLLLILVLVVALVMSTSCSVDITVRDYPYCPKSDSAMAAADSIPLGCPDTTWIPEGSQ